MPNARLHITSVSSLSLLLAGLISWSPPAHAEDLDAIFSRVNGFVAEKNYSKALEELSWARKELEKMNTQKIQSFFPDQLGDFTGGKIETNGALGFTNIERRYTKGGNSITVSLTGQSSAGGQGLGGIAALGKMAAMFGQQSGQDTFRIAGRTAMLNKSEGSSSADLTIFLDSGSILKLEDQNNTDTSVLRTLAEKFDIEGLEKYLRGNA